MHYLLMIHADESAVRPDDIPALMEAIDAFDAEVTDAGQNLGSIRLQTTGTAATLRARDGKALRTDGPFAETKEQLGGIYIIEASDMDEAIQIASRLPMTSYGSVEVRPILGIDLRQVAEAHYDSIA